jgi:hypothetical protein
MRPSIYIDPRINMNTNSPITVIIHFKTLPAHAAVAAAKANGITLSLEKAEQDVKESHRRFQEDLQRYLGQQGIPFTVTHTYTVALNGAAIRLPGNKIPALLQSAEIAGIYANQEYKIEPPPFQQY